MVLIIIICLIIAITSLIAIFLINKYNNFQWIGIKLNKAENNISSYLEIKYDILLRKFEFIKDNVTVDEDDFAEYKFLNTKISINKLNQNVKDLNNLINRYIDNNEELYKKETIENIDNELKNVNISLNSAKRYYNNHLKEYNNLCKSFPSKIIAQIFKYKTKEFIDEDVPDTLKILNQEN